MKKKLTIGVLYGGPSAERDVSLVTGKAVADNLDKKKYTVTLIEYTKDKRFFVKDTKLYLDFANKHRRTFDCIFIALHGSPGEDGTVQGMFETLGIRYTGSGVLASALAMNKVFAGQIYVANQLPHPFFIHVKASGWKKYKKSVLHDVENKIGYPAVVKPVDQGSAVGVSIAKNKAELLKALNKTFAQFSWLMIQQFIKGKEATCGVLEVAGELVALPPTRIVPNLGEFYDYKSKYAKGGSTHVCPADFPNEINQQIQKLALFAHKALRCDGMSRTDIFVADNPSRVSKKQNITNGHQTSGSSNTRNLYIIETNTIPGMTPTSLFPEACAQAGITFSTMLDHIIKAAL